MARRRASTSACARRSRPAAACSSRPSCSTSTATSTAASCGSTSSSACAASAASTPSRRWSSRWTATWSRPARVAAWTHVRDLTRGPGYGSTAECGSSWPTAGARERRPLPQGAGRGGPRRRRRCDCATTRSSAACDGRPTSRVVAAPRPPATGSSTQIKGDPDAYRTAVLLVEPGRSCRSSAPRRRCDRGVQDYPRRAGAPTPSCSRASRPPARTKDAAGGARRARPSGSRRCCSRIRSPASPTAASILTQLAGMVSGARRHDRPLSVAVDRPRPLQAHQRHARPRRRRPRAGRRVAHAMRDAPARRGPARPPRRRGVPRRCCPTPTPRGRARSPSSCAPRSPPRATPVPSRSASAGRPGAARTPDELLRRADEALYAAKAPGATASGRSCYPAAPHMTA